MAADATSDAAPDAYQELLDQYRRAATLGSAGGVLGWDQQVMMPEGGTPARAQQLSTVSSLAHDLLTDDRVGAWLDDLADADLTPSQAAVVREIDREYRRETRVSRDLVERISSATSESQPVWRAAKAEDDWESFEPVLEELVELKREYAAQIDPDRDPYEVLFEDYEPYLGLDTAERVLGRLRDELVPLIEAIRESDVELARPFTGSYDTDEMEALSRDALDLLGYDWDRGRLDRAPHPFSTGNMYDARVTSRYREDDLLGGLMSTIHEFGHANYTLGLPDDQFGTPLGDSRDMTVHESQSRFWENHVGRSAAFWERFLPTLAEHFPETAGTTVEDVYESVNQVYDDNLIRVEADELTYHMHIITRFEIETQLIRGEMDVSEVPAVWNDKMESYLGIRPETDTEGCLQDIHWSQGSYGYFPTYSLGSVLSAQLYAAAEDDLGDLDDIIREGEFQRIRDWQVENVHRYGCRYTTPELIETATGESYTADYFLDYATEKFSALYGL